MPTPTKSQTRPFWVKGVWLVSNGHTQVLFKTVDELELGTVQWNGVLVIWSGIALTLFQKEVPMLTIKYPNLKSIFTPFSFSIVYMYHTSRPKLNDRI